MRDWYPGQVSRPGQTLTDDTGEARSRRGEPVPGLVLVFSNGVPVLRAEEHGKDGIVLGRSSFAGRPVDDERVSTRHARVARTGAGWSVADLGSRNGTFLNGDRVVPEGFDARGGVVRV